MRDGKERESRGPYQVEDKCWGEGRSCVENEREREEEGEGEDNQLTSTAMAM